MKAILNLKRLGEYVAGQKGKSKKVVLAHGCFDLLHPGHIRHLRAAKAHGDILVVTVTPDKFVKKGPGRPVFSEQLRLETLAALEFVDAVALNEWPTAVETIRLLEPDIYIKGAEYRNSNNDPTGEISNEKKAVESIGGKMEFTDEITFSSTSLLNEHFDVFPAGAEAYLRGIAQKYDPDDVRALFEPMKNWTVAVIGDTIIDEYSYVRPMGRVEKAPIVACRYLDTELFAGGILAVANHISNFVKRVELVTVAGDDDLFSRIEPVLSPNIEVHLYVRPDGPTTLKRRYLHKDDLRKMFALEFMNDKPIPPNTESTILKDLPQILRDSDLTVVADFGHGAVTERIIGETKRHSGFLAVNAQTNSSNFGFNPITRYLTADFISIDETELRIATKGRFDDVADMLGVLRKTVDCPRINITLGANGSHYSTRDGDFVVPALAGDVLDTVGAGDAVLSVLSLCTAAGFPDEIIPLIGNCAGAIAANILCNETSINRPELFKMIKSTLSWG